MKAKVYNLRILTVLLIALSIVSCGELGDQPPETVSIMTSPDGSKIVRLYSIFTVNSYRQEGGSTHRSGYTTSYLEEYDGKTGQLISKEPLKIEDNCKLLTVTQNQAWLTKYNRERSEFELFVVNIADFSKAFDAQDLAKNNGGLKFKTNYSYFNPPEIKGVILNADDARLYSIDETSGIGTVVPDNKNLRSINRLIFESSSLSLSDKRFGFEGNTRKRLVLRSKDKKSASENITSETDFISPFIVGKFDPEKYAETPLELDDAFLIVSKSRDDRPFEFQFTAIDQNSLKTKWTATLQNFDQKIAESDLLNIQKQDGNLLIITKNSINLLDANSGNWVWNKSFVLPEKAE